MQVTGIITEYNPFHKGHRYQLKTLRKTKNPDYVVIAMSGNFLQRGTTALMDKYARTRMALLQGADLVFELPAWYAAASAERFARGGAALFAAAGVVDTLCFGAECHSLTQLVSLSSLLLSEPDWYRDRLDQSLRRGLSYPAARAAALPEYAGILDSPNNILALEYLKAITQTDAAMTPFLIPRKGSAYHEEKLSAPLPSATAIRHELLTKGSTPSLENALPKSSLAILKQYQKEAAFLCEDDFSLLLHQRLLTETAESLNEYADFTPSLSNRIEKAKDTFSSFHTFCQNLNTKDMTYARISRLLTHLLLNIKKEHFSVSDAWTRLPYLRVLGFRREAAPLLTLLKEHASCPLLTNLSKAESLLTGPALDMLHTDLYAADLYRCVLTAKTGRCFPNEYQQRMLVVEGTNCQ